jgi:uncharacterized protein
MTLVNTIKNIEVPAKEIAAFCQRWGVRELALFGSILREDFSPASDIDVLVTFNEDRKLRFVDLMNMETELKAIFGRDIDLGTRRSVEEDENYLRRRAILNSAQVIYAE